MKHLLARLVVLILLLVALVLFILSRGESESEPVPELREDISYESAYTNASEDLIVIASPLPGEMIASPLTIRGEARGTWYFEATAPVSLVNWDGLIIAEGYVTAQDEWMTEDFVPFEGTLVFNLVPAEEANTFLYPQGALILHNSNPSDLSENDRAVEIPIRFF